MSTILTRPQGVTSTDLPSPSAVREAVHWSDPEDVRIWIAALRSAAHDGLAAGEDATRPKRDRVLSRSEARRKLECGRSVAHFPPGRGRAWLVARASRAVAAPFICGHDRAADRFDPARSAARGRNLLLPSCISRGRGPDSRKTRSIPPVGGRDLTETRCKPHPVRSKPPSADLHVVVSRFRPQCEM
jgi:hypothetical protein